MKIFRTVALFAILVVFVQAVLAACIASQTNYYVSSSAGNDANDGLAATTGGGHGPWQTIAKVNSFSFPGNSVVSFNGGDTFVGCLVFSYATNMQSGVAKVNSYGTGKAIITSNCSSTYSAAVTIDGVNGFTLDSLILKGGSSSLPAANYSMWYPTAPPGINDPNGASSYSLGMVFKPNAAGQITGLKFYKSSIDTTTTRNLILWSATGTKLATCATASEPTGTAQWLGCTLGTAYVVTPGTIYVVSVDQLAGQDDWDVPVTSCANVTLGAVMTCLGTAASVGAGVFPSVYGGTSYTDVVLATNVPFLTPMTPIGLLITNNSGVKKSNITASNLDISNFAVLSNQYQQGEIFITGDSIPSAVNGPLDQLSILNNSLHGPSVSSPDRAGIAGYGYGLNITNVTYSGNTIWNLAGTPKGFAQGINIDGVDGAIVQHNIVHDIGATSITCGGSNGIEAFTAHNVAIKFNEVYNVRPLPSYVQTGCDWVAFDLDGGVYDSIMTGNYSHNNYGTGYEFYTFDSSGIAWGNNTLSENISENDGLGSGMSSVALGSASVPSKPFYIYNNTFYKNIYPPTNDSYCFLANGFGSLTGYAAGTLIANNICDTGPGLGGVNKFVYMPYVANASGISWKNNQWFGSAAGSTWRNAGGTYTSLAAWQTAVGETGSLGSDPLLTAPGTGGTLSWTPSLGNGPQPGPSGYALGTGSPAHAAGANLTSSPYNFSIPSNYYGATWAPNIGAY